MTSKRNYDIITVLIIAIIALAFFYINTMAHFYADDYMYSFKFEPKFALGNPDSINYEPIRNVADYFSSLSDLYKNLTGRIVPHGLLQLFLLLPSILFDIVNTIVFLFLTFFMTKWALGKDKKFFLQYWLLCIFLYYLAVAKTIPNFYYPAFSCNYLWTQLIVIIFLLPFREMDKNAMLSKHTPGLLIIMFLGGIIAGDTNEPLAPGILLAIGCIGLYSLIKYQKVPWLHIVSVIGLMIGFVLMFFAPGNNHRAVYESQNGSAYQGLTIHTANFKTILWSLVYCFPAILLAFAVSCKDFVRKRFAFDVPFAMLSVIVLGIVFFTLFSPLYLLRINILFVGFVIMLCLYMVAQNRKMTLTTLMICIVLLLPVFFTKLGSDFIFVNQAQKELRYFETEVDNNSADSILVSPRAYADPLTRHNWAKPIAAYYGKRYIWIYNELDSLRLKQRNRMSYNLSEAGNQSVTLNTLSYVNNSPYQRTFYIDVNLPEQDSGDIKIILNTMNFHSEIQKRVFDSLPGIAGMFLTRQEQSFRQQLYKKDGHRYLFCVSMRNASEYYDYIRIKFYNDKNERFSDIILRSVEFTDQKL